MEETDGLFAEHQDERVQKLEVLGVDEHHTGEAHHPRADGPVRVGADGEGPSQLAEGLVLVDEQTIEQVRQGAVRAPKGEHGQEEIPEAHGPPQVPGLLIFHKPLAAVHHDEVEEHANKPHWFFFIYLKFFEFTNFDI